LKPQAVWSPLNIDKPPKQAQPFCVQGAMRWMQQWRPLLL
jgi:hypothetical protein